MAQKISKQFINFIFWSAEYSFFCGIHNTGFMDSECLSSDLDPTFRVYANPDLDPFLEPEPTK